MERVHSFGAEDAEPLRHWRQDLLTSDLAVHALGSTRPWRLWEFHLAYCEAGLAMHHLDVARIRLARKEG